MTVCLGFIRVLDGDLPAESGREGLFRAQFVKTLSSSPRAPAGTTGDAKPNLGAPLWSGLGADHTIPMRPLGGARRANC